MNFETISIESPYGVKESIVITREDGSLESFPVDENNPRYIQFLAELEEQA